MSNVVALRGGAAPRRFPELGRMVPPGNALLGNRAGYSEIRFGDLTGILSQADLGNTVQWGELSRRMLRTDAHLYSVYETRITGVAGARWEIDPGTGGNPETAKRAAIDCRQMLESLGDVERVFSSILDGIAVGYSVHEIPWIVRGGLVTPEELVWLHPRRIKFSRRYVPYLYDDGQAWSYAPPDLKFDADGATGMALAPGQFLVHIPRVVPDYAPMSGLLQTVAREWWVSQWVTKFWLGGAELAGNPRVVASLTQAASDDQIEQLRQSLEQLSADGVLVARQGVEVDWIRPLAEGSASVWSELSDRMDARKSKAFLGSTLNVEVTEGGGNRALGESQYDRTQFPRVRRDGRAMWNTVQRGLFAPFLGYNLNRYGGVMPPLPSGRFVLEEEPVTIDELAVDCGVVTNDDVRKSRGLAPWGKERGGDRIVTRASTAYSFPQPSAAPTSPAPAAPSPPITSPGGAPAVAPFRERPWETVRRAMTSTTSKGSSGASPTSTSSPSPTRAAPASARRSDGSADLKTSHAARSVSRRQLGLPFTSG